MKEVTIGKHLYRINELNAFKQLHIVKRLTPCLNQLAPLFNSVDANTLKVVKNESDEVTGIDGDFSLILGPLSDALGALKDDDMDYILNSCLEATERKQAGGGFARLRKNSSTMFDDLTLPTLLQIAYHVIMESLTDFFKGGPAPDFVGFMKAHGLTG